MLNKGAGRGGEIIRRPDAERELACGPVFVEAQSGQPGFASITEGRGFGHNSKARAFSHHAAYALERSHTHTHFQLPADAGRLCLDMLLKRPTRQTYKMCVEHFRQRNALVACKRMIARQDDDQPIDCKGTQSQSRRFDCRRKDSDLGESCSHKARDFDALPFFQLDINLRVFCQPRTEARRQEFGQSHSVGSEANGGAQSAGMFPQLAAHLRHLVQNKAGMVGQCGSSLGQLNATASALQQLNLSIRLHVPQAFTGGGQRQASLGRAMGDAAGLRYSQEKAQVCQVEAHGASIGHNLASE